MRTAQTTTTMLGGTLLSSACVCLHCVIYQHLRDTPVNPPSSGRLTTIGRNLPFRLESTAQHSSSCSPAGDSRPGSLSLPLGQGDGARCEHFLEAV